MIRSNIIGFPGLLVALLLAVTVIHAQTPDAPWTLDRCLNRAIGTSPRLGASTQAVRGAEAAARASDAARFPNVGVGGAYSYASKVQEIQVPLTIPGVHIPQIQFGDGNVYDFTASARIPLYAGGALRERSRADVSAATAANDDYLSDSLKLVYDVRRAYFNALGATARDDAASASAERLARHLKDITNAKAVGTMSEENRLAALASLRQAESAVVAADAAVSAARLQLGNLVGEPGTEIVPESDLDRALLDTAGFRAVPAESRVEVAALNARIGQSRHLLTAQQGSLLPSLSGNAAYHYGKPGVNFEQNKWMDYYVLGVTASWTLSGFPVTVLSGSASTCGPERPRSPATRS